MKIKTETIRQLVKEELIKSRESSNDDGTLQEHRGTAMRERGIKGQQLAREREEANTKRTEKNKKTFDRIYPGFRELRSLGHGVIAEGEISEDDDDEFIKIKKDAFQRLITENKSKLTQQCNNAGMKTMEQWLRITNAFADAGKGKFGDKK